MKNNGSFLPIKTSLKLRTLFPASQEYSKKNLGFLEI
jgi:hypothetical protein